MTSVSYRPEVISQLLRRSNSELMTLWSSSIRCVILIYIPMLYTQIIDYTRCLTVYLSL